MLETRIDTTLPHRFVDAIHLLVEDRALSLLLLHDLAHLADRIRADVRCDKRDEDYHELLVWGGGWGR